MRIEKIDRVAINVKNLDEAAQFFSNLLGTTFSEVKSKNLLSLDGKKFRAATCPEGLELFQEIPHVEKEGMRAIIFKVSNIQEARAEMEKKGMQFVSEFTFENIKETVFYTHGIKFVLAEYEPVHGLLSKFSKNRIRTVSKP